MSPETIKRLSRYAEATRRYEIERYNTTAFDEWLESRKDLSKCSEPQIQEWVHQIQLARVDEAMVDETKTAVDVIAADHAALLANNELLYLGHKFRAEREAQIQPHRRRRDGRRNRSRTNRRRRS